MSTQINDGGPAFPVAPGCVMPDNTRTIFGGSGMSLRDWFAGQALAGILATMPTQYDIKDNVEDAYAYADALLAERQKGKL